MRDPSTEMQHLVSRGYQQNFANAEKRVAVIDARSGRLVASDRPIKSNFAAPGFITHLDATGEANAGTTTPEVAPHPVVRQSRCILFIGVALILGGIAFFVLDVHGVSRVFLLYAMLAGAALVAFARYQSRTGLLVAIHNATFALSSRGAFADAIALSERIPASLLVRLTSTTAG